MRRIVIIEDNAAVVRLYESKLKAQGNTVMVAMDGAKGLDLVKSSKPDLVLIDLMLPNMSGVEIIKNLRSDRRFAHLPIMAYSSADEDLLAEAVEAGSTTIISKNEASFREILDHVQELIKETRTWQIYTPDVIAEREAGDQSANGGSGRVLIVEDDRTTARLTSGIVERLGLVPVIIEDGQDAVRLLTEDSNFALAILDVELPRIKGTDILKHMRTERRLMSIPVIVMSALDQRVKMQFESHASGASFFVAKPFNRSTFEALIKALAIG